MGKTRFMHALTDLGRATANVFSADGCRALSAGLVYYSTLSVVPLLIIIFALPGLIVQLVSLQAGEQFTASVSALLGPALGTVIVNALERVQNQSLLVAGVSLAMLLYSASSVFRFLRYAFRWIWRAETSSSSVAGSSHLRKTVIGRAFDYLLAFGMVFAAPFVVLAGFLIFGLALFARGLLVEIPLLGGALSPLVLPLMLLGIYAGIYLFLLWALPPVRLRWREIWLPGLLCATVVLVTTYMLGLYLRFFSASSLYGAIGTIFALQIWTYANAMALFSYLYRKLLGEPPFPPGEPTPVQQTPVLRDAGLVPASEPQPPGA